MLSDRVESQGGLLAEQGPGAGAGCRLQRANEAASAGILIGDDTIVIRHCIPIASAPRRIAARQPPVASITRRAVKVSFCVRRVLSPLLANILLDDLDRELEARGHRFARYADDLLVLVKSERAGQRVKASLTAYLARRLKLPVNEHKSRVTAIDECVFLGFTFRRGKLRWSEAAFDDFKHRVRELTGRSWGVSMRYRFEKLAQYVRGWMGYFGISQYYRPIPELDEWLRRRVRMCYWKQWRGCRTKVGHLLALGSGKRAAILTAISSKSYWHLSRTLATQTGMTNDWLKAQGLVSVRELWMKAHG